MANSFELNDRKVIPNWRDFYRTVELGELGQFRGKKGIKFDKSELTKLISNWHNEKSIVLAGELLSSAFILKLLNINEVDEAIDHILNSAKEVPNSLLNLAKKLKSKKQSSFPLLEHDNLYDFSRSQKEKENLKKIQLFKRKLEIDYRNPVVLVELSRLYSLIGNMEKAEKYIRMALSLAINNRYIVRSATRFFSHIEDHESAKKFLRKSELTKFDPWVMSSAISMSIKRKGQVNLIKKGLILIENNKNNSFDTTELASSIATLEMENGKHRNSRKLFNQALVNPNDNSLAQAEWATKHDKRIFVNDDSYNEVDNPFEALALMHYHNEQYEDSVKNIEKWFLDIQFSTGPIMMGSHISATYLNDHKKAIEFCNLGLIANPKNAAILNNLCYSLALNNDIEKAEKEFKKTESLGILNLEPSTKISLKATEGLIAFRKGQIDKGRFLYKQAIEIGKKLKQDQLVARAYVNYAREELLSSTDIFAIEKVMNALNLSCKDVTDNSILYLKKNVEKLFEKKKASIPDEV